MLKTLTPGQKRLFDEQGYVYPVRAFDADRANGYRLRLEAYEKMVGHDANRTLKIKGHLAFPWLLEIASEPNILDAIEDLIGPDILLYGASAFVKDAHDPRFVSWHQDSAYFGLTPHREVTAWVALSDASSAHGCLRVAPGSHRTEALTHVETYAENNMLAKGQTLTGIDEAAAVEMPLTAGECSLHHEQTAHSSLPNTSDERRVGFAFFYIPTSVKQISGRGRATLLRGEDRFGHWDSEALPRHDLDPLAMEQLADVWGSYKDKKTTQVAGQQS